MAVELAILRTMHLRAMAASFRNGFEEASDLVFMGAIVAGFKIAYTLRKMSCDF